MAPISVVAPTSGLCPGHKAYIVDSSRGDIIWGMVTAFVRPICRKSRLWFEICGQYRSFEGQSPDQPQHRLCC